MSFQTPEQINKLLRNWQQGDCILGDCNFLFGYASSCPIREGVEPSIEVEVSHIQELVIGFMVLTQTCDIRRDCSKRPYIEVASLEVEKPNYHLVKKFMMPVYVAIPTLESEHIVANLEKTTTFEKSVFSIWSNKSDFKFVRGFETNEQIKNLAWALGRKRSRFAFPDEFEKILKKFKDRIKKKHKENSDEGQMLGAIKQIRVRAEPDWSSGESALTFYLFIDREKTNFIDWSSQIEEWEKLIDIKGSNYTEIKMSVVDYEDITAQEYRESERLDLDALSVSDA